ncbi:MAG TPA: divalent-cation tolerance protein CutA [Burkholderiaceae bacterium]|nr:divalent-cation tolerance protein CutA [Burkholderiaceae bacterium]HPE01288.1 divalent-cation tolerance protein CutA [Burkholderiaceae bacterium]HRZ00135.1 divalent-cation tolerance protein CutA [Burkholderiaceae bacterium]
MSGILMVHTTCPDEASAARIAAHLVESRLAACVRQSAPATSLYRWQGALESATEVALAIKTTRERYPELEAAIRALHPYELPEILATEVSVGFGPYLRWIVDETQPPLLA